MISGRYSSPQGETSARSVLPSCVKNNLYSSLFFLLLAVATTAFFCSVKYSSHGDALFKECDSISAIRQRIGDETDRANCQVSPHSSQKSEAWIEKCTEKNFCFTVFIQYLIVEFLVEINFSCSQIVDFLEI